MATSLNEWAKNYKKILLYRYMLAILKEKNANSGFLEDVTRKDQELSKEYIGNWTWVEASDKYKKIFFSLDSICYYLSNLKLTLIDISNNLDTIIDFR
jgi:hypothetical protein